MPIGIKELTLDQDYVFHVTVGEQGSRYPAELKLTSQKITLKVMGEETAERSCGIGWGNLDFLTCSDFERTFLLIGLKATSGRSSEIERFPVSRWYIENHFTVDAVIYLPVTAGGNILFNGVELVSDTLADWIGNTKKQEQIVQRFMSGKKLFNEPGIMEEFVGDAADEFLVGVSYQASWYTSSPAFKAGITFPPLFFTAFKYQRDAIQAIQLVNDICALFAFITGGELDIQKIYLPYDGAFSNNKASLYYPRSRYPQRRKDSAVLFPLGRDLRFDTLRLPELQFEVFDAYFRLDETNKRYFEKYIRYRRLENVEERFLGYFRLLESLCHKKGFYFDENKLSELTKRVRPYLVRKLGDKKAVNSFLHNLPKFNSSKYNTEKCIGDFFCAIPEEASSRWIFKKSDLASICKLRNDISHANDYYVDEVVLHQKTIFVEVLLVIALFNKLGVRINDSLAIIDRLSGYRLIQLREENSFDLAK